MHAPEGGKDQQYLTARLVVTHAQRSHYIHSCVTFACTWALGIVSLCMLFTGFGLSSLP